MKCHRLIAVLFILTFHQGFAQHDTEKLFTVRLDSVSFEALVGAIESNSGYRFYYSPPQTDSLKLSVQAVNLSIADLLDEAFKESTLRYTIDGNDIYVLENREIRTGLPVDFFRELPVDTAGQKEETPDPFVERDAALQREEANLVVIGKKSAIDPGKKASIAGYVTDVDSGEPVIGAVIMIENPRTGIATDQYGFYSLTLPTGRHELIITSIGMRTTTRQVVLYGDGRLDIRLKEEVVALREIVVEADRDINVMGMQMGVDKLNIKTLRQIPTAFGETDILKVALSLPGVQTVGESSVGLNVRGGTPDQNLILYNDAVIYNPSHLFGFFSAFNPDMLKEVELHKSAIPASLGGRLSSVMHITSREGNKKKFQGAGGIGLLTSRFSVEGPIIKDKLSFVAGGRTTYSNWILSRLKDKSFSRSKASFYDLNVNFHYDVDEKNTLFLSVYHSGDEFRLNNDTTYSYNNQAASFKWKHVFKNSLYGVYSFTGSRYNYEVSSENNPINAFAMDYEIRQMTGRADFNYYPNTKTTIDFGIGAVSYKLNPGTLTPKGESSQIVPKTLGQERAIESSAYVGSTYQLNSKMMVYGGLRYAMFSALGPRNIYLYGDNRDKDEGNIIDTVFYDGGVVKTYQGPEVRLSLRYILANNTSLKVSYTRMRQFIHLLSNTTAVSPTDTWKLSDSHIKPSVGDQYALGFYKNFPAKAVETSFEVYYKRMRDFLDYKNGATLLLNEHLETDVIGTFGKAYGAELLIKKQKGKLNGWISYTYSRSFLKTDDRSSEELVNNGAYYRSNFDKPHDITLISNYQFSKRFSISFNFTHSTGRPITLPLQRYPLGNGERIHYSDRNEFRIPNYTRIDAAINVEGNHRVNKLAHSSWTFSVYNLTGRRNAYSVFFRTENGTVNGYKLSIFGQPIPTLTYNFRF